jgi:hypothetical protein
LSVPENLAMGGWGSGWLICACQKLTVCGARSRCVRMATTSFSRSRLNRHDGFAFGSACRQPPAYSLRTCRCHISYCSSCQGLSGTVGCVMNHIVNHAADSLMRWLSPMIVIVDNCRCRGGLGHSAWYGSWRRSSWHGIGRQVCRVHQRVIGIYAHSIGTFCQGEARRGRACTRRGCPSSLLSIGLSLVHCSVGLNNATLVQADVLLTRKPPQVLLSARRFGDGARFGNPWVARFQLVHCVHLW